MKYNTQPMTAVEFRKIDTTKKKPIKHEESELQQRCVARFRQLYKPPHFIFAIPNGGIRKGGKEITAKDGKKIPLEAIIMKREGVTKGIADLFVFAPFNSSAKGLFLECKKSDGVQKKEQKEFESICIESGYNYAVFRNEYEFINIIRDFFKN